MFVTLYLFMLLVPAGIVAVWDRTVARIAPGAWVFYAATGVIGSPVHELGHVVGCWLFRLKITQVTLYSPNRDTGELGHVHFLYRPSSIWNQLGRAVQGIAPLVAGAILANVVLGLSPTVPVSDDLQGLTIWIGSIYSGLFDSFISLVFSGIGGFLLALLLSSVCLHAIPSMADIRIGLGGFITLAVGLAALFVASNLWLGFDARHLASLRFVASTIEAGNHAAWWLCAGVIGVLSVAVLASGLFLLVPAAICRLLGRRSVQGVHL